MDTATNHFGAHQNHHLYHPFNNHNHNHNQNNNKHHRQQSNQNPTIQLAQNQSSSSDDDPSDQDGPLNEALLAVASAEEYAAKIIKLQQACLTPLKEDLAEWLNKIMSTSSITTDNFMDKLDNGVIICRLAKIISLWCRQQFAPDKLSTKKWPTSSCTTATTSPVANYGKNFNSKLSISALNEAGKLLWAAYSTLLPPASRLQAPFNNHLAKATKNPLALRCLTDINNNISRNLLPQVHSPFTNNNGDENPMLAEMENYNPQSRLSTTSANGIGPLRSTSQPTNCFTTSSMTSLNNRHLTSRTKNQFLCNLTRMEQTKIWEDAKCRTFYARDNVCNFIRWSKEFGVNQSVLFESDDLVLHANPRQVVLCLLDVARIACVKHGFTEAPGLVKFEQQVDRDLAAEKAAKLGQLTVDDGLKNGRLSAHKHQQAANKITASGKLSSLNKNSRKGSIANNTDDLIVRYCLHKEEEAARKKAAAKLEAAAQLAAEIEDAKLKAEKEAAAAAVAMTATTAAGNLNEPDSEDYNDQTSTVTDRVQQTALLNSDTPAVGSDDKSQQLVIKSSSGNSTAHKGLSYDNGVDSLDSGEGRTESASTTHSRTPMNGSSSKKYGVSAIPIPIKRSDSNSSMASNITSRLGTSDISSSRSSLLSCQESTTKRHIASVLDGKVMRIAKSYYGKSATKGVTRLSEGKYKIADRIVFVRLLKGHRVMVRIGGGWDTLENFLFRHKSDPSQVIDVDSLLPLETKMTFEENPQLTPSNNKFHCRISHLS